MLVAIPRVFCAEHPVPLEKDFDAAQCASCHEEKTKGKAVHSAIAAGCTACHDVKTGDPTTISLSAPAQELCFTCHEKSDKAVQHKPYAEGRCVVCHDPHTSDHAKQLRADKNDLCLECHDEKAKHQSEDEGKTFVLFGGKARVPASFLENIRQISVLRGRGHPMTNHPTTGSSGKTEIGCLTCHQPHAAKESPQLLVTEKFETSAVCVRCH
jgi:predicted CXXCH cytochrome family protein